MYSLHRKLGVVVDSNAPTLGRLGDTTFIYATVYDCVQVYRYDNMSVCLTTKKIPEVNLTSTISSIVTSGHDIYAAVGSKVYTYDKISVNRVYALCGNIVAMTLVGKVLLLVDDSQALTVN